MVFFTIIFSFLTFVGPTKPEEEITVSKYGEIVLNEVTLGEREMVDYILDNCPNGSRKQIDPYDVLALIRLEEKLGVPKEVKGILPAVFCIESGLKKADDLVGDNGLALGPAQFHVAAFRTCVISNWARTNSSHIIDNKDWRRDFLFSARCWITNTMRVLKRIEKECPDLDVYGKWQVAEANVANWVRYKNYKCKAKSKHFKLLEVWQQNMIDL